MPIRSLVRRALTLVLAGGLLSGADASALAPGPAATSALAPGPAATAAVASGPAATAVVGVYSVPLSGRLLVVRGFDPPSTPYGPGHLGVDLRASAGAAILAAADGVVRFAGPVAGRGVIVLAHPDGITTEYEPVRALVAVGQRVPRGEPIARLAGTHPGCPGRCLHWGARRGATYLDPLTLLRPLGPVVLLPWPRPP